ncbi:laccase domain-containing protein, partial [Ligilactobacillus salivarius]
VKQIGRIMTERWVNEEGSRLTDIQAVIGPSISAGSYTVDDRVINEVRALPFTAESAICETEKGQYQLALTEVNRLLPIPRGIPEANPSVSGLCTERERELFFSHRRDKGKTGRMMSFIGMKEA